MEPLRKHNRGDRKTKSDNSAQDGRTSSNSVDAKKWIVKQSEGGERTLQQKAEAMRDDGPLVWLDMDQKALDDAYDQTVYAPNREMTYEKAIFNSERVRSRLGPPRCFSYGPTAVETLDVFSPKAANAPVHIYIHGGAWRQRKASEYAYMAELFVRAGAHCVIPDFIGVEGCNGDLMTIADQVTRAVAWVGRNAASFGGDANRIYISGQSSGAQLGGVLVTTDWAKHFGLPRHLIKGALLCSGMYDLKPVRLSKRSRFVTITDEAEDKLSAQRHLDRLATPLVLAHGTHETPEFKRQTREFHAAVLARGLPVQFLLAEGYNHFDLQEMASNPYSVLGSAALDQMQLGGNS
jgi:arylformamidase